MMWLVGDGILLVGSRGSPLGPNFRRGGSPRVAADRRVSCVLALLSMFVSGPAELGLGDGDSDRRSWRSRFSARAVNGAAATNTAPGRPRRTRTPRRPRVRSPATAAQWRDRSTPMLGPARMGASGLLTQRGRSGGTTRLGIVRKPFRFHRAARRRLFSPLRPIRQCPLRASRLGSRARRVRSRPPWRRQRRRLIASVQPEASISSRSCADVCDK